MDERIITILKEVARGEHYCDDTDCYCLYCSGDANYQQDRVDFIAHLSGCPVLLAREVLKEQGVSLCLYRVSYDRIRHRDKTERVETTASGYTAEEIKQRYSEQFKNMQIEYIRDI